MAKERFINGITNYGDWRETREDNKKFLKRMEVINKIKGKDDLSLVDYIQLVNTVMVSEMTGKLEGIYSISTSVLMNERCQKRAKNPDSICARCYAAASLNNYTGLMEAMETNHVILNTWLIPEECWKALAIPTTNGRFRIEAFGDVASVTCARNYIRIIRSHEWVTFGVWTKNPDIWVTAFEMEGGKPKNMTFLVSSPFLNVVVNIPETWKKYVDHVFTVYNKKDVKINCGARDCKTCDRCYDPDNKEYHVSEKLK